LCFWTNPVYFKDKKDGGDGAEVAEPEVKHAEKEIERSVRGEPVFNHLKGPDRRPCPKVVCFLN